MKDKHLKPTKTTFLLRGTLLFGALASCEPQARSQQTPTQQLSITSASTAERKLAASPESSELAEHLLRVLWEAEAPQIKLIKGLEGAEEALTDGQVEAALSVSHLRPSPQHIAVASSELWWAARDTHITLSEERWLKVLRLEPNAPYQLCLRALPDPLELAWSAAHPQHALALTEARRSGRAPLFYDDQTLLRYLNEHPHAVALFDVARLRYYGAPLRALKRDPHVKVKVWFRAQEGVKGALGSLKALFEAGAHRPWLQDLGWERP